MSRGEFYGRIQKLLKENRDDKRRRKKKEVCKLKDSVGKIQDLFGLKKFVVSAKQQQMDSI